MPRKLRLEYPGALDILGIANPTAAVTVNGNTAYRKGDYFDYVLPVSNASGPQYPSIKVASSYPPGQSSTGNVYVPKTPELFSYDADGNLTSDGRWKFTWDAENRLLAMTNNPNVPDAAKTALVFAYDWQGRRVSKTVYTNNAGNYVLSYSQRFVYDGWNLLAVLTSDLRPLTSFVWGTDLSGSFQGAGGVGGLLRVTYNGTQTTNCFAAFNGNGNVIGLVNAADGGTAAQYESGPFGEVIRATGPMAKANPFRFSTKYQDDETDLVYYGYRYYNTSTGAWPNRDPIQEDGGLALYGFADGDPVGHVDALGQCPHCSVSEIKGIGKWFIDPPGLGTGVSYVFAIVIKFDDNTDATPACCKYVQRVKSTARKNGVWIPKAEGGLPMDGNWHVDKIPWKDDTLNDLNGSLYHDRDPSPAGWLSTDSPGLTPLASGDSVEFRARFALTVVDTCNGDEEVARSEFYIRALGTYPKDMQFLPKPSP